MRKKIMKINQIVIQTLQITILPTICNIPTSHISRPLMVSPLSGKTLDGRGKTKQPCQTAGLLIVLCIVVVFGIITQNLLDMDHFRTLIPSKASAH